MSGQIEWQPKTASETVNRFADFTDELASGEALNSATAVATVWSGNDSSPGSIISSVIVSQNSAGVSAIATVTVTGGVLGTIYQCLVNGFTTFSKTITKAAALAVKPPLN